MHPRSPAAFNVPMNDGIVEGTPRTSWGARKANPVVVDVCQLVSTAPCRMRVTFPTRSTGAAFGALTPIWGTAEWGDGSLNSPSVVATAVGVYVVTALATAAPTPGQWTNAMLEVETVSFLWSTANLDGSIAGGVPLGEARTVRAGNVITVYVYGPPNLIVPTGAANNGAGLVRVTSAHAHGLLTGAPVSIVGMVGTTEANGAWTVTVIDATHFDLNGSTFANAFVSGGMIYIPQLSDLGGGVAIALAAG